MNFDRWLIISVCTDLILTKKKWKSPKKTQIYPQLFKHQSLSLVGTQIYCYFMLRYLFMRWHDLDHHYFHGRIIFVLKRFIFENHWSFIQSAYFVFIWKLDDKSTSRGWCIKFATGLNNRFTTICSHFVANYIDIFHKTVVQTVIFRCWTGLYLFWFKSYATNKKNEKTKESAKSMENIIQMIAFLQNSKNSETEIFVFCVIIFDPITI